MRDGHRDLAFLIAICTISPIIVVLAAALNDGNGAGIVDLSSEAVYVGGDFCTVNMGLDRPLEEVEADLAGCLREHRLVLREQGLLDDTGTRP